MRKSPALALVVVAVAALSLSLPAFASGPQFQVREILAAVSAAIHHPQLQGANKEHERKQRVRQIIFDTFEFEEMARIALGPYWGRLTTQQRMEFVSLFGDLFERSYNRLVVGFLSEREAEYGATSIERDRAIVQTTLVVRKTNEQLPVNYRLIDKGQRWSVYDVVVDGVSLAQNYRAQFDKIIRSASYETLVEKIKTKLAQETF